MTAKLTRSALEMVNFMYQFGTTECPDTWSNIILGVFCVWMKLTFKQVDFNKR